MRRLLVVLLIVTLGLAACVGNPYERVPGNVQRWEPEIERWAEEYNVPREYVIATISLESCGRPNAESGAGARGLFQVMPFHFEEGEDPFDVETNAKRGMNYLSFCYEYSDRNARLTSVCYNGGSSYTHLPQEEWPSQTVGYSKVFEAFVDDLTHDTDDYLGEWMEERGVHCNEQTD